MRRFLLCGHKFGVGVAAFAGFFCVVFGVGLSLGWTAPSVSGVTGSVADGNSITITGSGFGSTGPNVILFDDFEGGTDGETLSDRVRAAKVGTWRDVSATIGPYYPTYSRNAANSGSLALRQDWGSGAGQQEGARFAAPTMGGPHTLIYFSWWMYLPSGQNVPGACCGYGANWKQWWLASNDGYANDYGFQTVSNSLPAEMAFGPIDGGEDRVSVGYQASPFTKGRWTRFEVYMVGSTTSSGAIHAWFTDSAHARYLWQSATGDNTLYSTNATGWNYLHFPGYGRYDSNSNTYYDDIYVAAGSGARARVEIGNQATYSACTNLAVSTPTSWSDTQIMATVRKGSFAQGQAAYLFVVDASGAVNSQGFPVTIGAGGTTELLAPTGLTVKGQ
jgi:hypothetical protein